MELRELLTKDFGLSVEAFAAALNDNQGVLTLSLFLATLVLGWISGIFSALRRRPILSVNLIEGPTFACTFPTGNNYGEYASHRTGISLYMSVSNIGTAPSSIDSIEIAYHWSLKPLSMEWIKYRVGWFWLTKQTVALEEFQVAIGSSIKVFPFLTQRNTIYSHKTDNYLKVGQSVNGVVYFEQGESWGGCFPANSRGYTSIKIRLRDVHRRSYTSKHKIPVVEILDAKRFNPRFGETHFELHRENKHNTEMQKSKTKNE